METKEKRKFTIIFDKNPKDSIVVIGNNTSGITFDEAGLYCQNKKGDFIYPSNEEEFKLEDFDNFLIERETNRHIDIEIEYIKHNI